MMHFLPEFVLISTTLLFFFLSLKQVSPDMLRRLALGGAFAAVAACLLSFNQTGVYFFNAYSIETFSQLFKLILCVGFSFVIAVSPGLSGIKPKLSAEYYFFLFLSTLGLVMLSSAAEFLTLILTLEISSFCVYVIIPFRRKGIGYRTQMEAALKYMLLGALATGMTLYGVSYVYGVTHTTYLHELGKIIPDMIGNSPLLIFGFVLILCGTFFKLALFPMHFWAPDVYQGSSNETATYVATIPKVGAALLLLRLITLVGDIPSVLTVVFSVLAVLSMTLGNLSALVQNDIKRLMAYSSIAHAGYLMVGIAAGNNQGVIAAGYYVTAYVFLNIACFYVVYHLAPLGNNIGFSQVRGLYKRSPVLAATLAVGAVGLAGIPPTAGFMGKFLVFLAAIDAKMIPLVIFAVINAGISAFFYLKLIRAAYTVDAVNGKEFVSLSPFSRCVGGSLIAIILLMGIFPRQVIELFDMAVRNALPFFLS